jgi:DNA-binding MarR family transcriptional regulator
LSDDAKQAATHLENLFPRVQRALFHPDPEDPLRDLPLAQLRMMRLLFGSNRTPSELSVETGLSISAVTQLANRLEALGLVSRRVDEEDRRVRYLGLSPDGQAKMNERQKRRVERAESVLAVIDPARRKVVIDALEDLYEAARKVRGEGKDSLALLAEQEQRMPPPSGG